jgi:hypothetical protein
VVLQLENMVRDSGRSENLEGRGAVIEGNLMERGFSSKSAKTKFLSRSQAVTSPKKQTIEFVFLS